MGQALAGQRARVWADEGIVHVTIGGQPVKTVASGLGSEDLAKLRMRDAAPGRVAPTLPEPSGSVG